MGKSLNLFVPSKAPSHRQQRVAQEIRFYLSEILMRGDIPARYNDEGELLTLPTTVTVTDVRLSPDLKHATVFVMPLGGQHKEETIAFLKIASGYFRKMISQKLQLRVTPKLVFEIDPVFSAAEKIDEILKKV